MRTANWRHTRPIVALIGGILLASCSGPKHISNETSFDETFYVSMIGTRMHRLSGVNPTVGVFASSDGGETWQHTGWEQGKTFATVVAGGRGDSIFVAAGNGVMRSVDGGRSWRTVTGWEVTEVQDVATSARRPSDVFAATPYGIFRSQDFGGSWEHIAENLAQPYVASIRVDRENPDHVVAGTEGGMYRSVDGGDTWTLTDLEIPVRSVRQNPIVPSRWAAALQDFGAAVSLDNGSSWTMATGITDQTFYEIEFHPVDPDYLLAGGWHTGLMESTDGGKHWIRIGQTLPVDDLHGIAFSRQDPLRIIVGSMSEGVFVSTDGAATWSAAEPQIFDQGQIWDVFVGGEE